MTENIRVKNVSLILQQKHYHSFQKDVNQKGTEVNSSESLNTLKKENPKNPERFQQRYLKKNIKLKEKSKASLKTQVSSMYWKQFDDDHMFDNEILLTNEPKKKWIDDLSHYHSNVKINKQIDKSNNLFSSIPRGHIKTKLYKFFHFNEITSKWEIDSQMISSFFKEKLYHQNDIKTPLILFSHSYEKDVITLNSKLIFNLYPELDETDIYVYGICERSLSLLQYNINLSNELMKNKPIFLLLHVPENKTNIKNINTILFKIYYFLSIICDVEVIILNKEYYSNQISNINSINNIKVSYSKTKIKKSLNESEFENFDFDFDDLEEKQEVNHKKLNDINKVLENFDVNVFMNECKLILLVNDESVQGDITETTDGELFKNIRNQISPKLCHIHYINISNVETYRCFLTSLKELSLGAQYSYQEILNNFKLNPISNISSMYINLKSQKEWKRKLNEVIKDRFEQMSSNDGIDDLFLIFIHLLILISMKNATIFSIRLQNE